MVFFFFFVFGVLCLGFGGLGVWGFGVLGFGVWGLGFRVQHILDLLLRNLH